MPSKPVGQDLVNRALSEPSEVEGIGAECDAEEPWEHGPWVNDDTLRCGYEANRVGHHRHVNRNRVDADH